LDGNGVSFGHHILLNGKHDRPEGKSSTHFTFTDTFSTLSLYFLAPEGFLLSWAFYLTLLCLGIQSHFFKIIEHGSMFQVKPLVVPARQK